MLVDGREGLGPGTVNSNVAWTGEPRAIWWLSIEGFRSELNIRRSSPLQAIPSNPFFPLPQDTPHRGLLTQLSLAFPRLSRAVRLSGCQVQPHQPRTGTVAVGFVCATSPSGPFAEKCLSFFRPGHHQCHGRDVGQGILLHQPACGAPPS